MNSSLRHTPYWIQSASPTHTPLLDWRYTTPGRRGCLLHACYEGIAVQVNFICPTLERPAAFWVLLDYHGEESKSSIHHLNVWDAISEANAMFQKCLNDVRERQAKLQLHEPNEKQLLIFKQ